MATMALRESEPDPPPAGPHVYSHGRALLRVMSWRSDHSEAILHTPSMWEKQGR